MLCQTGTKQIRASCIVATDDRMRQYLFSFGSVVQKGKFSAGTALWVKTLKKVDFLRKKTNINPNFPHCPLGCRIVMAGM